MPRAWYRHSDEVGAKLDRQNRRDFNKARLTLDFDELNVLRAKKHSDALYTKIDRRTRECLWDIYEYAYMEACAEVDGEAEEILEKHLDTILSGYDPVTRYVYTREVERKRARYAESIVADREMNSRLQFEKDAIRAASLWEKQARQYRITVEDKAVIKAYTDNGVTLVEWVTLDDEKVCETCRERNGQRYKITNIPPKPHYGCRCYIKPILTEKS